MQNYVVIGILEHCCRRVLSVRELWDYMMLMEEWDEGLMEKIKEPLVEIGGAKALWLCGYKVGKVYKLASNWNHGSKPGRKNNIKTPRWPSSRLVANYS